MRVLRNVPMLVMGVCLAVAASAPAFADRDNDDDGSRGRYRGGEYKESFWDGPCKVERELKRDGSYKEERECKGVGAGPYRHPRGDYEEKYTDGPCRVEREWKRDGVYKEKIDCKGPGRGPRHRHEPVVIAQPPWIVLERTGPTYRPGWEPPPIVAAPSAGVVRCNRELIGGVIGGVAGGVLGSQVGKGTGRTVATIGGAIAGVLIGGAIGRSIDVQDQACIGHALEVAQTGQRVTWQDRHKGAQYAVTPGQIERRADGRYCRGYNTEIVVRGKREDVRGTACRQVDGIWVNAD